MELSFESLYDGIEFSAIIEGRLCIGKVSICNGGVYLCQNMQDGSDCGVDRRHGYDYSWIIRDSWDDTPLEEALDSNGVENFKIINRVGDIRKERINTFYNKESKGKQRV